MNRRCMYICHKLKQILTAIIYRKNLTDNLTDVKMNAIIVNAENFRYIEDNVCKTRRKREF